MKVEILLQLKTVRNIEVTDKNLIKSIEGDLILLQLPWRKN